MGAEGNLINTQGWMLVVDGAETLGLVSGMHLLLAS